MSFTEVIEGWKNLFNSSRPDNVSIEAVAERRMQICKSCPFNSANNRNGRFRQDEHCTKCGCTLAAKVRSLSSSCPVGKWGAVRNVKS